MHDAWHRAGTRRVGFLLFHWHVVDHFKKLRLPRIMGVAPYTVADFNAGGDFAEANWDATMAGVPPSTSLDELVAYSQIIEGWHGEAHMVIGDATGAPMMNPLVNIFYTAFWNLHFFINEQFEAELRSYARTAHPELRTPEDIVQHVLEQHHRYVAAI